MSINYQKGYCVVKMIESVILSIDDTYHQDIRVLMNMINTGLENHGEIGCVTSYPLFIKSIKTAKEMTDGHFKIFAIYTIGEMLKSNRELVAGYCGFSVKGVDRIIKNLMTLKYRKSATATDVQHGHDAREGSKKMVKIYNKAINKVIYDYEKTGEREWTQKDLKMRLHLSNSTRICTSRISVKELMRSKQNSDNLLLLNRAS